MASASPTDLELVRGLRARDPKALARVYGDYHAAVYNLCARILADREEAQDVTQDVFLKAFSKPPAETKEVSLRPWLYRVATNACLNLIRARRSGGHVEVEALPARGDPYEQAWTAALIETSLAGMNERYRAALVLKDLHGLHGRELAEVLEVSRPAADVLVHRARASFRRVFAGLAGSDATAPANLAVALPVLAVPAALQAAPLPWHLPGTLTPASGMPPVVAPIAGAPAAGPAGAAPTVGLLAKLTAALTTKAAVIAAGAAVVAGGGIAAVHLAGNDAAPVPASGGGVSAAAGHEGTGSRDAGHDDWAGWAEHRHLIAEHLAHDHHASEAHHSDGGHDGAHESGSSGTHHAADAGHTASATHDPAADEETSASSSTTSSTHAGGDGGHDGGDGGDE